MMWRTDDLNYSIANYPRTVASMIRDALPWTAGLLGVTTLFSFAAGTFSGCVAGVARRAALDAMDDAAVVGAACHSVFSAWPGADVPARVPDSSCCRSSAATARARHLAELDVRAGRPAPRRAAGAVNRAGLRRRLGAGDARHDGHHDGRGLRHVRRGEGTDAARRSSPATASAMRSCHRRLGWRWHLGQILSGAVLVEVIFGYPVSARCCSRRSRRTTSF